MKIEIILGENVTVGEVEQFAAYIQSFRDKHKEVICSYQLWWGK